MENNKPTEDTAVADVAEATEDAVETETNETENETESSSSQDFDIDAAIEEEKKRVPDPEKAKEAFKKREERRAQQEQGGDESSSDDDRPLTFKDLQEIESRVRQKITNEVRTEQIQEIVSSMADSPKERELIIAIHSNRVFPSTMPLNEQLLEAHFIANGKRLAAKNQEVVRALKSKETASKDTATVQRDSTAAPAPKLAADVAAALKRSGYTYDASAKVYKKALPNGKFLYNDPRTKKTWVR